MKYLSHCIVGKEEEQVRQSLATLLSFAHLHVAGLSEDDFAHCKLLQNNVPNIQDKGMYKF